jgi:hypothetical protein
MHICEVCFQPSTSHESNGHEPPLCCDGCPCGQTQEGWRKENGWRPTRHTGMDGVTGNDTSGHGTSLCDNDVCSHPSHYKKRVKAA